jgi:hypothetical protein
MLGTAVVPRWLVTDEAPQQQAHAEPGGQSDRGAQREAGLPQLRLIAPRQTLVGLVGGGVPRRPGIALRGFEAEDRVLQHGDRAPQGVDDEQSLFLSPPRLGVGVVDDERLREPGGDEQVVESYGVPLVDRDRRETPAALAGRCSSCAWLILGSPGCAISANSTTTPGAVDALSSRCAVIRTVRALRHGNSWVTSKPSADAATGRSPIGAAGGLEGPVSGVDCAERVFVSHEPGLGAERLPPSSPPATR